MRKITALSILFCLVTILGCQGFDDKTDKVIIGKWKVTNVAVNIEMPEENKEAFRKVAINNRYDFKEDNSYTLTNESYKQAGAWEYKEDLNAILLKPETSETYLDTLKIEAEDKDHITIVNNSGNEGNVRLKVERIKE